MKLLGTVFVLAAGGRLFMSWQVTALQISGLALFVALVALSASCLALARTGAQQDRQAERIDRLENAPGG